MFFLLPLPPQTNKDMLFVKVDRARMMRQRSTGQEILSIRVVVLCFGHVIDLLKRNGKVTTTIDIGQS